MQTKEVIDKKSWEGCLAGYQDKTFLQSWQWGDFQEKMGNRIWRIGIFDGDRLLVGALIVRVRAKRGIFLMIQHLVASEKEFFHLLLERAKEIGRHERASFIRITPLWERSDENQNFFQSFGFREAPMHVNAYDSTWKLDLGPSEETLLANMRKTTRYLIRQAGKNKDIEIVKSVKREDVETFTALNTEVGKRQRFVPFSKKYTETEFDAFLAKDEAVLFLGKYQGKAVAGALVIFWSGIGFYHQAASLAEYAKLSVPYRVQWEAIKEAKRRGCALYDFWGYVNPKTYPKHPWAGPTLFKMGFGGKAHEYITTQDYPLSFAYWPTAIFEKARKMRRRV